MNYFWPPVIKAEISPVRHSMVKLIRTSPCAVMKLLHMAVHDCLFTRFKYRQVSEKKKSKTLFSNSFKAKMYMVKLTPFCNHNISFVQRILPCAAVKLLIRQLAILKCEHSLRQRYMNHFLMTSLCFQQLSMCPGFNGCTVI